MNTCQEENTNNKKMERSIGLMTAAPYSFTLHTKKNLEE
jgi:hypothetical protein